MRVETVGGQRMSRSFFWGVGWGVGCRMRLIGAHYFYLGGMTLFTLKYAIQIPFLLSAKRKTPFFWHTAIKLSSSSRALQCLLRRWNKARIKEGTHMIPSLLLSSRGEGGQHSQQHRKGKNPRRRRRGRPKWFFKVSRLVGWLVARLLLSSSSSAAAGVSRHRRRRRKGPFPTTYVGAQIMCGGERFILRVSHSIFLSWTILI